ncbi:MAG: hypothetical protein NTY01_07490 [Verrucomicrobia bacterium]|nr:hypothetical protein [Verrucomicrobiota bacterium]
MQKQKSNRVSSRNDGLPSWVWPVALVALVVIFLWRCFTTDQLLMSNDGSLATLTRAKAILPDGFLSGWLPGNWLGSVIAYPATPTWFLLYLMPVESFARLIYVFHALAVSLLTFYWLRRMDLCDFAAFFGSLVMTFAGSYLTYILPGHIGKFEMTTFAILSLLCLTRALQTAHWLDFAWGGVALGLALAGAIDSGALMALLIAAWFLFSAGRRWLEVDDHTRRNWVLGFMLLMALSAACALPIVSSFLRAGLVTNVPGGADGDTSEQNWQWATQWSYPPAEVVDLFAPGYHGWKSQDSQSPYWGALGRNPQFDPFATPADLLKAARVTDAAQASQLLQFWSFRFNGDFHGTVTFLAVLMAITALFARETQAPDSEARPDWRDAWLRRHGAAIIFWTVVAVVVLLISFGRYFPPPFRMLHSLPPFNSMRNPNKLLVILTPALAVLAAIGMDRLWRESEPPQAERGSRNAKR